MSTRSQKSEDTSQKDNAGRMCAGFSLLVSLVCLLVSACGFEPLHADAQRQGRSVDLANIQITVSANAAAVGNRRSSIIPRRYLELLKVEIEDNVNPHAQRGEKRFALDVSFSENDIALFVNPDGTASRGDLNYTSSYAIKRLSDGVVVASGSLVRVSSYNSSPTADFASYVSIEDARKRGILELAQDYKLRLATLLPTLNDPKANAIEPKPVAPAPALQPVRNYETLRQGN